MLRQQRRANGEAEPAAHAPPERKPSANEMAQAAKDAAQKPPGDAAAAPAATPPPRRAETGLSAMERALGVPGVAPPEGAPGEAPPSPSSPPPDAAASSFGEIEIEGRRYSQAQLREAVLKSADYTQKTQEIAQARAALQQQQQALATVLPYIQPELQRLGEMLQRADTAQMPDPALAQTDPTQYVQLRAAYDAAQAEQQRLGSLTTLQQQAHERAMAQQVATANEQLAAEYPFWRDPAQRLEAQNQIVDWATSKGGFTRDELRGLADPRHLKLMMKARAYDHWVEGARTTAPPQRLAAPPRGAPPPPAPTARVQEAATAFDSRPNFRTGAALLAARRANS
jgi:hypothetical protein